MVKTNQKWGVAPLIYRTWNRSRRGNTKTPGPNPKDVIQLIKKKLKNAHRQIGEQSPMHSTQKILQQLNQIYAKIPPIPCQHCHSCEGPIIWFQPEQINIKNHLQKNHKEFITWPPEEFTAHQMHCPYLEKNRCSIYPVRPLVCRLQGTIPELPCPHNTTPALTSQQLSEIKNDFNQLLKQSGGLDTFYSTRTYPIH
ncbi:MAG: YkgJ family cysteine cluster protein [Candidatus Thermoplasmatota archaeon]|nr:YkgJ family cysteine cluster protein [Candidatus Thermoplasmatota archaeon]